MRLPILEMHVVHNPDRVRFLTCDTDRTMGVVTIGADSVCSCRLGAQCDHVLYILHKVLRFPAADPILWKVKLSVEDTRRVLRAVPDHLDPDVIQRNELVNFVDLSGPGHADQGSKRIPKARVGNFDPNEDACPVCFDTFARDPAHTMSCANCRNSMHPDCMNVWAATCVTGGVEITCPMCRSPWK